MGLFLLNVEPRAHLTHPVSVGGGCVICSHGKLSVPAPAVAVILRESGIPWHGGPLDTELFTPTGAAILAALKPGTVTEILPTPPATYITGNSRGGKILAIPPLEIRIYASGG